MKTINKKLPLVSYIITVKNGEKYIGRTLKGVKNQTYKNIELIVVDNYSTDKTGEIAKKYGAKVYLKGPERSAQLKYGLEKSKGKYIFTTGCDLVADRDYIEKAVKTCEEKNYDAIYTSVVSETHNFWSKVKGLERLCYIGDNLHEAARFLKKGVFLKIGGFDDKLRLHGDEYDVQARLDKKGYKTGRIDAVETHIDEIDSLKEVFFKSFYYGYNSKKYIQKHTAHSLNQLQPFRTVFLKKWPLLLKKPHLTFGLIVFKIVQYSSAIAGILIALIGGEKVAKKFHQAIYKNKKN